MSSLEGISFIVTCKGRLEHLRKTLPKIYHDVVNFKNIFGSIDEIIVVDYDCPENSADWVTSNFGDVKVVTEKNKKTFNISNARNVGAAAATKSWLCFFDADMEIGPGFVFWLHHNIKTGTFYVKGDSDPKNPKSYAPGIVVCERLIFNNIGGYDEVFNSWGGEDLDILERLAGAGATSCSFPGKFIDVIDHDDSLRMKFYDEKHKYKSYIRGRYYASVKKSLSGALGGTRELPLEARKKIMHQISDAFQVWDGSPGKLTGSVGLSFVIEERLGRSIKMKKKIIISTEVDFDDKLIDRMSR